MSTNDDPKHPEAAWPWFAIVLAAALCLAAAAAVVIGLVQSNYALLSGAIATLLVMAWLVLRHGGAGRRA